MKLVSFEYNQSGGGRFVEWNLSDLYLSDTNLIVGINSAGKSRTLQCLYNIGYLISSYNSIDFNRGNWNYKLGFETDTDTKKRLTYSLEIEKKGISESLYVNDECLMSRAFDEGEIFSESKQEFITISPPKKKLVIHVRRDTNEFPYFELLAHWAENIKSFSFSNISPRTFYLENYVEFDKMGETSDILDNLSDESIQNIINDFNEIGYPVLDVNLRKLNDRKIIFFKEKGLKEAIPHCKLSQGMYRSFSLLVVIESLIRKKKDTLLLIDDLGEGLDYRRATNLGKLLFTKLENGRIQLIATSNDSFLMDVVDISYWNVLVRNLNRVKAYNVFNSKEIFSEFEFSGLSNFDFLSSDFLLSKIR